MVLIILLACWTVGRSGASAETALGKRLWSCRGRGRWNWITVRTNNVCRRSFFFLFSQQKSMKYGSTAPSAALTPACLLHASREHTWSLQCCCTVAVVFVCVYMFTVAQNLLMCCKCQGSISLLLTQMPQASCVAGKGTFYSNDFNVSYYFVCGSMAWLLISQYILSRYYSALNLFNNSQWKPANGISQASTGFWHYNTFIWYICLT